MYVDSETSNSVTEQTRPIVAGQEGPYRVWDCPDCGTHIKTWDTCPACGWNDVAAWNRALVSLDS